MPYPVLVHPLQLPDRLPVALHLSLQLGAGVQVNPVVQPLAFLVAVIVPLVQKPTAGSLIAGQVTLLFESTTAATFEAIANIDKTKQTLNANRIFLLIDIFLVLFLFVCIKNSVDLSANVNFCFDHNHILQFISSLNQEDFFDGVGDDFGFAVAVVDAAVNEDDFTFLVGSRIFF
jgi:hypothetical protein